MKKRITIGTLTLLSLMGMFGCKQQETVEALMTLDVKADYPEKEWVCLLYTSDAADEL